MEDGDIMQCVQVQIELGHRSSLSDRTAKDGFTHKWTVFVRGTEGSDISHFVKKVVFHLHESYANPRRVVKEPPYYVSETGYAGFNLPISIHLKKKEKPRKIKLNYNLFPQMHEPVSYLRCQKLTFKNPTDKLTRMLIKAGGEKVSEEMLNFSGDETTSSSGKDIGASLKYSAKEVKIDNNSKDHDVDSGSSSSSASSTSKENVLKTQSSREKHSSNVSNNLSKMVPNPSLLPSQKRSAASPLSCEKNHKKARLSSVSSETVKNEDKHRSEERGKNDKVVKHKGSENKDEPQSKSMDGKDSHKMDACKQMSNSKEKKKESKSKDDKSSKYDDKKEVMADNKMLKEDKKEKKDGKREIKDAKKKEKVSEEMPNISGNENTSSSGKDICATLKSSAKEVQIDHNTKDKYAAYGSSSSSLSSTSKENVLKTQPSKEKHSSKISNSLSKMVPSPSILPSRKRQSDSPISSERSHKKARLSSVSSETVKSEDKQKSEERAKKDKVVKHKGSDNKDESQSKSKDGKDSHKTDVCKQKSSMSSKERKKESESKEDTISKYDDKKEVRADKKELKDDKKEVAKDAKNDKKEVKNDKKAVKDTIKKIKDGKKKKLVLPHRVPQFADLFGPPIKLESSKKQPSTISSEKQPTATSLKDNATKLAELFWK